MPAHGQKRNGTAGPGVVATTVDPHNADEICVVSHKQNATHIEILQHARVAVLTSAIAGAAQFVVAGSCSLFLHNV